MWQPWLTTGIALNASKTHRKHRPLVFLTLYGYRAVPLSRWALCARLIPLDASEEGGKAGVQVKIVLDVLGIIKVSACSSETVEGLPEVVVGVLISPALAFEHVYGLIVLSNDIK
jgi:hypothetical protein